VWTLAEDTNSLAMCLQLQLTLRGNKKYHAISKIAREHVESKNGMDILIKHSEDMRRRMKADIQRHNREDSTNFFANTVKPEPRGKSRLQVNYWRVNEEVTGGTWGLEVKEPLDELRIEVARWLT
jgi:hypothetical protein